MISFTVPIPPQGKARPRAAMVGGHARIYTPDTTRRWESDFALVASQYAPASVLDGPVRLRIVAVFPRPKRLLRRADPDGLLPHASKPDADNVAKAVLDALKAWWRDDAQVSELTVMKRYAERDGIARVEVQVETA